jgi:DsbC/DsbD-like thiol-disulfide interchange protein
MALVLRRDLLILLLLLSWTTAGRAASSAWVDHQVVQARLVAAAPAADGELRLGLQLRLAAGWHAYWKYPGDAGLAPEVELSGDRPMGSVRLLFPPPRRMPQPGDLIALGYEGEVLYPLRARASQGGAPRRITAAANYLVCAEECIPFRDKLTVDLPAAGAGGAEEALLAAWERKLPHPLAESGLTATTRWERRGDGGAVIVELRGPAAAQARTAELFLETPAAISCQPPSLEGVAGGVRFRSVCRALQAPAATLQVPWTITGLGTPAAPAAVEGVARLATTGTVR